MSAPSGTAEEFWIKQEPITPAQSPAVVPVCGQNTAMATLGSSHRQTLKTNSQTQSQLLAGAVKAEDSPHRFIQLEDRQAKMGCTLKDGGADLQTTKVHSHSQTFSLGQKRKFATHGHHELDIASGKGPNLYHEPNLLMPVGMEEPESSAQYFLSQSASSKQRKCSAVTLPSKSSFSKVSEDWITYLPPTESGLKATKNRTPFSPHCVQDGYCNQKWSTKPAASDFPRGSYLHPSLYKESRCLKDPKVRSTSVTTPKWNQAPEQTRKTTCKSPNHWQFEAATSGHSTSRQAITTLDQNQEQNDMLLIARSSRLRSPKSATSKSEEVMQRVDKSQAAVFLALPPVCQKSQHVEPATPRLDRQVSKHQPSPADTPIRTTSRHLGNSRTSGTREDSCTSPAFSDSRVKTSAVATKQSSMERMKDTSRARIQQKLKAYPHTTKVSQWAFI